MGEIDHDYPFQVENVSGFKVRGEQISATFDVVVTSLPLPVTEEDVGIIDAILRDSHHGVYLYNYTFEDFDADGAVFSPTYVERLSFRWIGDLIRPRPREQVEAAFAAQKQAVLSCLNDCLGMPD